MKPVIKDLKHSSKKGVKSKFKQREGLEKSPKGTVEFTNQLFSITSRSSKSRQTKNSIKALYGSIKSGSRKSKKKGVKSYKIGHSKSHLMLTQRNTIGSKSKENLNKLPSDRKSYRNNNELSKTVLYDPAEQSQGGAIITCDKHPEKIVEGYCRKNNKLLCVKCILENNPKQYDYVSLSKAYSEQQQYLKNKITKVIKSKDNLLATSDNIAKVLDEIEILHKNSVEHANEFYANIFKKIEARRVHNIQALEMIYNEYKKELHQDQEKIQQVLNVLKICEERHSSEDRNHSAIKFLQQKQDFEDCIKNHTEVLESDILNQKSKLGFSFKREKFSLLQFIRNEFKDKNDDILIPKSPGARKSKICKKKYDQSAKRCKDSKETRNSKVKHNQFNTSKDYIKSDSMVSLNHRNSSSNSRATTKVKGFSSRLMAPTKSSEMRVNKTIKHEMDVSKRSENKDNSSILMEEISEGKSESQDTPVVSFHGSDTSGSQKILEQDSTPIVSASVEIYNLPDSQNFGCNDSQEIDEMDSEGASNPISQPPYNNVYQIKRPMDASDNPPPFKLSTEISSEEEKLFSSISAPKSETLAYKNPTSLDHFKMARKEPVLQYEVTKITQEGCRE
ncbi:unnamed protein product [Moneuplotes crassus]|uniref:B box-type domain-containing protein n=1 Tax=Euplotes crassus TaxID=5936 RepID=A0AAD1X3M4_EUPCR|nr:unnamed protein product [Moneuplotes crassus]